MQSRGAFKLLLNLLQMKQVSTILKTGDTLTIPDSKLIGKVGTYKDGKIKVMWQIDNCSGISENLPTREWNRRIKEGKIIISQTT